MTTATPPILPTDARPIASLASTRQGPVREMTALLTRRYGPGLQIRQDRGRTTWLLPAGRKQVAL